MKKTILAILLFQPILIFSQEIKYINESGFDVKEEIAEYYREIYWDSIQDNSVLIKKYKISGELIEIGYYSKKDIKLKNGILKEFDKNGHIEYYMNYIDNKLDGELIGYHESGQIRRKDLYKNGLLINGQCFTASGADTTYYPMIIMPTFKGQQYSEVSNYIAKNLRYPLSALMKEIQGTVYVNFCINQQGDVCDMKIAYSDSELLNNESIRVIKKSSKYWKPGYAEGKLAKISFTLPIKYSLN